MWQVTGDLEADEVIQQRYHGEGEAAGAKSWPPILQSLELKKFK